MRRSNADQNVLGQTEVDIITEDEDDTAVTEAVASSDEMGDEPSEISPIDSQDVGHTDPGSPLHPKHARRLKEILEQLGGRGERKVQHGTT